MNSQSRKSSLGSSGGKRPTLAPMHSNSLPSTPRQKARDTASGKSRSPSPTGADRNHSPRSVSSESNRTMPSLRPTHAWCKYQSTQTSRRRIPYTIGSDMLEPEVPEPASSLPLDELTSLNHDLERLYHSLLPSEESQKRRKLVVEKLQKILREEWPQKGIKVFVFGSSGNLLCTNESDGMKGTRPQRYAQDAR